MTEPGAGDSPPPPQDLRVRLGLPADAAAVGLARIVVTGAARQAGLDADRVEDLRIAVSECATAAVAAASGPTRVQLAFGVEDGAFVLCVSPAPVLATPLDDDDEQWAVLLVDDLADTVERADGELLLRFSIPDAAPTATAPDRAGAAG